MQSKFSFALFLFSLPAFGQFNCNPALTPSAPRNTVIVCTMQHQEFVGGIVTRKFGVVLPKNFSPAGGMILKVGGTTHGFRQNCFLGPAANEEGGWIAFLNTVPANAPAVVCPEGWFDSGPAGYNSGERWNSVGHHNWNWVNGVVPNDQDFLVQLVNFARASLGLNPKIMAVGAEEVDAGKTSAMASDFVAKHANIVSTLFLYGDQFLSGLTASRIDTDGTFVPNPVGPVSVIELISHLSGVDNSMCGNLNGKLLTADDVFQFFTSAVTPISVTYLDPNNPAQTKFCSGQYNSQGQGKETTMEVARADLGNGREARLVKLVGNAQGVPWGSDNYQGQPDATVSAKKVLHITQFSPCNWTAPCNHYGDPAEDTPLEYLYDFILHHPLP